MFLIHIKRFLFRSMVFLCYTAGAQVKSVKIVYTQEMISSPIDTAHIKNEYVKNIMKKR